jgi:soluble lytic murein transglycosylase-like protein
MSVNQKIIVFIALALMGCLVWFASASAQSYSNDASLIVRQAAIRHHVPVDFALRVARHETGGKGGRCGLRGAAGEVGPLQILPSTARAMGYRGVVGATCEAQTDAGMAHLAYCYRKTSTQWLAAACHNQGVSVAYGRKVSASARRYANAVTGAVVKTTKKAASVTVEAASYPVRAVTSTFTFMALMAPPKAHVKPAKVKYQCNWANCPK